MTDLRTAGAPPVGPEDHVRGAPDAPLVVMYGNFECHVCLVAHERLRDIPVRLVFRHFSTRSQHPRALPAACAAEAAACQGAFWPFYDALFADIARLEDPHLWTRAQELGLDVTRFDADRRSTPVLERVQRDFQGGVRAGVVSTPTLLVDGQLHPGAPAEPLRRRLRATI